MGPFRFKRGAAPRVPSWAWGGLAAVLLAGLAAWAMRGGAAGPDDLFRQARSAAQAGDMGRASELIGRLAALRSPTVEDRLLRAQVAGKRDEALAIEELAAIPEDDPLAPLARLSQGQLEARRGRLAHAERALLATLKLLPDCVQARKELVYIYSVQQRLVDLDAQLAALGDLGQLDLTHLLHWGRVRHVAWSAASDLNSLRRYFRADPTDLRTATALADALIRLRQLDEAGRVLERLPGDDPEALVIRIRFAEALGRPDEVNRLLDGGPQSHPALERHRGQRALGRGAYAEAERHFRTALATLPGDRASLAGLSTALAAQGRHVESREVSRKAQTFDRLSTWIADAERAGAQQEAGLSRRIGLACAELGRKAEARSWLERAIALDPLDVEAQNALAALRAGGDAPTAGVSL